MICDDCKGTRLCVRGGLVVVGLFAEGLPVAGCRLLACLWGGFDHKDLCQLAQLVGL